MHKRKSPQACRGCSPGLQVTNAWAKDAHLTMAAWSSSVSTFSGRCSNRLRRLTSSGFCLGRWSQELAAVQKPTRCCSIFRIAFRSMTPST